MRTAKNICVAFNGPPGIGKDTLADLITNEKSGIVGITISEVVRAFAASYYDDQRFVENWTREWKDTYDEKYGKTPREALIEYSETRLSNDCNKYFQMSIEDYIAERAAEFKNSLITDLGYPKEAEALAKACGLLIIVRLHADGFEYCNGDTRQYIDYKAENVETIDFNVTRGRAEFDSYDIRDAVQRVCEDYFRR